MKFFVRAHPVEVKEAVAGDGVFVEYFVELAQAEEENLIIMKLLQSPILYHGPRQTRPSLIRNMYAAFIILRVVRPPQICITYNVRLGPPGQTLLNVLVVPLIEGSAGGMHACVFYFGLYSVFVNDVVPDFWVFLLSVTIQFELVLAS